MKKHIFGALAGAGLAFGAMQGTATAQIVGEPCETCGVALGAPLPEGVYFVDNENYGQRDGQGSRLGVNVPITAWSTPFSFYDTRLEVLAAIPVFTHIDGGGAPGRFDFYSQGLLFALAHDFGNGFNAAIIGGPRSPDNFTNAGRGTIADIRLALSYVKDGYNFSLSFNYGGNLGGKFLGNVGGFATGFDDSFFIDYTATKKFGKFELGVVGSYFQDITGPIVKANSVSVGGLVGYDFGKFTVQAYVTREVEVRNGGWGLGTPTNATPGVNNDYDTRGFVRFIVPLYVAPTARPVVARY